MKDIINRIESRKFKFDLNSCLFIINSFSTQPNFISEKPKKELEEIFFHEITEKIGFWNNVKNKLNFNNNKELNVVQFHAHFYRQYMKFKNEISDFENFFKKIKTKGFNKSPNYLQKNYYSEFPNEIMEKKGDLNKINTNYYPKLRKIFEIENKDDKKINEQLYYMCCSYDNMKRNIQSHKNFKNSNAPELFEKILFQIQLSKENLDNNFKEIYINYITNLMYTFELININLLGNHLERVKNINEKKDIIEKKYENRKNKIDKQFIDLKKKTFEKIEKFINNINKYSNPEEESKKIYNDITKSLSEFDIFFKEESTKYKEELDIIVNEIKSKLDLKIDLNNSVFKKFMNIKHLISHIGVGFFEGLGGLVYMGLLGINPISLFFGLGILSIHSLIAFGTFLYDKINLNDTLINNMNEYKEKLIVQFEGVENKIEEIIKNIKVKAIKQIEFFVDSQNVDFKNIKLHKREFDKLFNQFKKIYEINE